MRITRAACRLADAAAAAATFVRIKPTDWRFLCVRAALFVCAPHRFNPFFSHSRSLFLARRGRFPGSQSCYCRRTARQPGARVCMRSLSHKSAIMHVRARAHVKGARREVCA